MSRIIRFIGDIHGEYEDYTEILKTCDESVQVGDFGMGFCRKYPYGAMKQGKHRYIRGNHDDPALCAADPFCIPDGVYQDGIFYLGGAGSIDKDFRTPGLDWWPEEELSDRELLAAIKTYEVTKPRIVVTHDCPDSAANYMLDYMSASRGVNMRKFPEGAKTRLALQEMLEIHQPELWTFGHWHMSMRFKIPHIKTQFVCLNILETIDVEIRDVADK